MEKAVGVLGAMWGAWEKRKNPEEPTPRVNAPKNETDNTGLYVGIGIGALLLVLGIVYAVKNNQN